MARVMLAGGPSAKRFQSACAFSIYLAISVLFFGLPLLGHFGHRFIGDRADTLIQNWSLAWWPYALASGQHSIITQALWAPTGYNLAWTTSIPGPSLALYPITRLFGPIVSYNILSLLCPPAAAFSAFVLCRYLGGRFWPAMVGGYIFGFSQYVLAQLAGCHLFLLFIFPVPLAIYLVLLRLSRRITRFAFLALLIALLLCEFFSSTELFATTAVFGAAALALSWLMWRAAPDVRDVAIEIGCAYVITALLAAPFLYCVFAGGVPGPINPTSLYSNDLLAFAVPTRVLYLSVALRWVARHFRRSVVETGGYLGPGYWIILVLYIKSSWSTRPGKFLILSLMFVGLMSLGPALHINGIDRGPAPWRLFSELPLIDQALPSRFGVYFFLGAAVIASLYLSQSSISWWSKLLLSSICLLSLAPNLAAFRSEVAHVKLPQFFRSGEYKRYLARNDNVLVLPYARREDGLLWQAQTDFYFRLAAARLTLPPAEAAGWPVLSTLDTGNEILDFAEQFKAFLSARGVKAIITDPQGKEPQTDGPWQRLLAEAGLVPLQTGGVLFYEVPPALVAQFRGATAREMVQKEAKASFSTLLNAARRYVSEGFPLPMLNPWQAQRLNLLTLPANKPAPRPADLNWWRNLWLGPYGESMVGIGIVGDYDDLKPLVDEYRADATNIFFPYPKKLVDGPKQGSGQLLITFTPEKLQRAARKTTGPGSDSG